MPGSPRYGAGHGGQGRWWHLQASGVAPMRLARAAAPSHLTSLSLDGPPMKQR